MINRYTRPEMGRIWSEENKYRLWLRVELAVVETQADMGLIPPEDASQILEAAAFEVERIDEIEKEVRHDVIAFLTNVGEHVGSSARFIHQGMTSSDLLDTALALQIREAGDLILEDLKRLMRTVQTRAEHYKHTPIMGRTHGVHAEPTTFGLKLALWYAELERAVERLRHSVRGLSVGKISGPVGNYSEIPMKVEAAALQRLGLLPAPITNQIIQRDRHAEFLSALAILGGSLEKFATEIRHLHRTEVGEVEEPFYRGQKGSSAMPHKRNPIQCEQIAGLARLLRSYAMAAMEDISLWHERDISHSSVERVILPDACILMDYMLVKFNAVVEDMQVHPEMMEKNIALTRGKIYSQRLLLALTGAKISREEAYGIVQRLVDESDRAGRDLRDVCVKDGGLRQYLALDEIRKVFSLDHYYRNVDAIFDRVFTSIEDIL